MSHAAWVGRRRVGSFLAAVVTAVLTSSLTTPGAVAATSRVYVSPGGNDAAAGTSQAPLRTIAAAIARTASGATVVVRSGVYHESLTLVGRSRRSVVAARRASVWLDGSRSVGGWHQSGSTWVSDGWTARFDSSPSFTSGAPDGAPPYFQFVNPAYPMAAHPDQAWIDGSPLNQVASRGKVGPGTFYVDEAAAQLVIGDDPTGRSVTASDLAKAVSVREPGDRLVGINVRNYATSLPLIGTVTLERPHSTFADAQVVDNAGTGLAVTSSGARVVRVLLARNGLRGFSANRARSLRLDRLTVSQNNTQHFNAAPAAGGAKITRSTGVVVRHSVFSGNRGTGLWFDLQNHHVSVSSSRFIGNASHGLNLELSRAIKVTHNAFLHNAADGVKVNDSNQVVLTHNLISANALGIDIAQDPRSLTARAARVRSITVDHNLLGRPSSPQACQLCVTDYTHRSSARQMRIKADANVYQHPAAGRPRWLVVWAGYRGRPLHFSSLHRFSAVTHQEHRGRVKSRLGHLREGPGPVIPVLVAAMVGAGGESSV